MLTEFDKTGKVDISLAADYNVMTHHFNEESQRQSRCQPTDLSMQIPKLQA